MPQAVAWFSILGRADHAPGCKHDSVLGWADHAPGCCNVIHCTLLLCAVLSRKSRHTWPNPSQALIHCPSQAHGAADSILAQIQTPQQNLATVYFQLHSKIRHTSYKIPRSGRLHIKGEWVESLRLRYYESSEIRTYVAGGCFAEVCDVWSCLYIRKYLGLPDLTCILPLKAHDSI